MSFFGGILSPHGMDRRRRRADPYQAGIDNSRREFGVLRQEAIAGMNRGGTRSLGCREQLSLGQIAFAGGGRADADRFVGFPNEGHGGIDVGVNGNRPHAEPFGRANDAAGDFAAIRDQHGVDHAGHIRNTPNRGWSGIGAFSVTLNARPRMSRVCAGSMMPSSQRRAVAK